ncbi:MULTISPECIES: hypothetical protein [Candidatus Kuenenia]|nr:MULTISPECIES: hypothetical protein [Kuenenia]MCL4728648.1 hypothetical protein [Candidatus Kuenenia stuttgartiensis]MCZ7622860.1 hypothetical protein [Candidatus Kuenenia sp.]
MCRKKPGMHLYQPHKGIKAARDVASLSPAGGGLRVWNCLRSVGKRGKIVFINKGVVESM